MIDLKRATEEFNWLKTQNTRRNFEYYLLRQAVKGNFRWPRDWPTHIPKVNDNLCKPIVERFTTYLIGKGFSWNLNRPNSLEFREAAERSEKILKRLFDLSNSELQFNQGAKNGSMLGRTVFKVYKKGDKGANAEHACFTNCQPDYFYGVPAADDYLGDWATVYYSYPIDRLTAVAQFGERDYKDEAQLGREGFYDKLPESIDRPDDPKMSQRRIPVLEVWTKEDYALVVGGITIFNGDNPYEWSDTGEGFIPFVVIENVRNGGQTEGEADIAQARELNEHLNYLMSRKAHVVNRWLVPTIVWEGAPQNYAEILASSIGGGGAIPTRLGGRISFLSYDRPNPAVLEMEQSLRRAILETSGMNDVALQGVTTGSINTGISLQAQFQPVLSTVEKKRLEWTNGLRELAAKLLQIQENIGDSKALGQAVINQSSKSQQVPDGELVALSGLDIKGLRDISIAWPGVLPKDDLQAQQTELQKAERGFQSIYTTLEKLGEEYPDDELARIRMENNDPSLRGEKTAEQARAMMPLMKGQQDAQAQMQQQLMQAMLDQQAQASPGAPTAPGGAPQGPPPNVGDKIRALARNAKPQLDMTGDEPVIAAGGGY